MMMNHISTWFKKHRYWSATPILCLMVLMAHAFPSGGANEPSIKGEWVAGDFHQHTTYTDGSSSLRTVMYKNNQFGLDWWANSEHGGARGTDARGPLTVNGPFNVNGGYAWTDTGHYPVNPIIGDGAHVNMWRWQSLRDFSFWDVLHARGTYLKPILQSLEWNVPGHEHCSVGNIAHQFDPTLMDASPIAQFEYLFDGSDTDVSGGLSQGWTDKNTVNDHAKAVQAVKWLQDNYARTSYAVFAHVERKQPPIARYVGTGSVGYNISDFRDFNNAAPDVAFGFESMPGHQKESSRGGYTTSAVGGGTYGGDGIYSAKIGGLWDALLGEGRHWWLFASSDFHGTSADFWPGEYQKTYTLVANRYDAQAILDGLRSGCSFVVEGDLINALDFRANPSSPASYGSDNHNSDGAIMGEELFLSKKSNDKYNLDITIRFRGPEKNNHEDAVTVDHIDLIGGSIMSMAQPGTAEYNDATNPTSHVVATFTSRDWKPDNEGWNVIHYQTRLSGNMYFRLRGTNLALNTQGQTDELGNPLLDPQGNTAADAWKDLWFYSNPIFVYVR